MCIDRSWNCSSEDIFNWFKTVFLITCYILSQSKAKYWFTSETFWSLCTCHFKYSKVNLDWCRIRSHFSLLCGSGRDETSHIPFLIICSWTDPFMTWLVLRCPLCISLLLYGLWTELTIMYRSSPYLEFKSVIACVWKGEDISLSILDPLQFLNSNQMKFIYAKTSPYPVCFSLTHAKFQIM